MIRMFQDVDDHEEVGSLQPSLVVFNDLAGLVEGFGDFGRLLGDVLADLGSCGWHFDGGSNFFSG